MGAKYPRFGSRESGSPPARSLRGFARFAFSGVFPLCRSKETLAVGGERVGEGSVASGLPPLPTPEASGASASPLPGATEGSDLP